MRALCIRIWRSRWTPVAGAVVLASIVPIGLASAAAGPRQSARQTGDQSAFGHHARWVSTWAASPQTAVPGTADASGFSNQTIRNVVFSSVSGNLVRVRFTNTFGDQPLQIGAASIAVAGTGAGTTGRNVPLTFGGRPSVQIPIGAEALSDPVRLQVPALQDLAVSVYLPDGYRVGHPALARPSRLNYVASGRPHRATAAGTPSPRSTSRGTSSTRSTCSRSRRFADTLVAFGDSITDGVQFDGRRQRTAGPTTSRGGSMARRRHAWPWPTRGSAATAS